MPITADTVTIAQYRESAANVDQVNQASVNAQAGIFLVTPVGQNDQEMLYANFTAWIAGSDLVGDASGLNLGTGVVDSIHLAPNSVTTASLADGSVTQAKLAADTNTDLGIGTQTTTTLEVTSSTGSNVTLPEVGVLAGLMTSPDKTKLDGIEDGANNFQLQPGDVELVHLAPDALTNLGTDNPTATALDVTSSTGSSATLPEAVAGSTAGLLNATDKTKIDSVVNVLEFPGVDPTGATDSRDGIQAALDTGNDVFVPNGTYLLSASVNLTANGQTLYGAGPYLSRFVSTITNGSGAIVLTSRQRCTLRDFSVWGQTQADPYQNSTGINLSGSTRCQMSNLDIRYLSTCYRVVDGWIQSAWNLWARDCGMGFYGEQVNDADLGLRITSANQPMTLLNSHGMRIDFKEEGEAPQTPSNIDQCTGINFSKFYLEHTGINEPSASEFAIGSATQVKGVALHGVSIGRGNSSVPLFALDDVDGFWIGPGNSSGGTEGRLFSTTANSKNVTCQITNVKDRGILLHPVTTNTRTPTNVFPDPYFIRGIPTFDAEINATITEDTTIVPPGMARCISMQVDGSFSYGRLDLDLTDPQYSSLLGQTIGIAAMIRADSNLANGATAGPSIYAEVDGTGGGPTPTRNQDHVPGEWVLTWQELAIPSDATLLDLRLYAAQTSSVNIGDITRFGAIYIWVGGGANSLKVLTGNVQNMDEALVVPGYSLLANSSATGSKLSPITSGGLPLGGLPGSRLLGWNSAGVLSEFDGTSVGGGSRKDGVDDLGDQSGSGYTVDFDAGSYDNKELTLTGPTLPITLSSTRDGKFTLRIRQDSTGFRRATLIATTASPPIAEFQLKPDSDEMTVFEFQYDLQNDVWHW